MGDGEMGFIPNVFRKIKAKFIQILKGETSIVIVDADGNETFTVETPSSTVLNLYGLGDKIIYYSSSAGYLYSNKTHIFLLHARPATDNARELGSPTLRWKRICIGTGGISCDGKVTLSQEIHNTKVHEGTADPNTDGISGAKDDRITYRDTSTGTVTDWVHDGTNWVQVS